MNTEINTNQTKLSVKARIGRGKGNAAFHKNARTKITQGKASQVKNPLKITRTIERGKARISVTSRNLIARGGKIVRIKRNVKVNKGNNMVKATGRKILQPKFVKTNAHNIVRIKRDVTVNKGNNMVTATGRKTLQSKFMRTNAHNKLVQNSNPIFRKVEFDDQDGLEVVADQDDFMGSVNYNFEAVPTFPKVPLLPTPLVQQRVFPPVHEPFHNNTPSLMSGNEGNFRDLEMQKVQNYEEELRAMERKRIEERIFEEEQKRFEEEQKRFDEEQRRFDEEQNRFETEKQREYELEQRKIEAGRKHLDELRKTLEKEKRDLELLKKTVEEEKEIERRSMSTGREMTDEYVGDFNSSRSKRGKGNFAQNQKSQNISSKPVSNRMPAAALFDYGPKKDHFESRDKFNSQVNNSGNQYGKEDFHPPSSNRMSAAGLFDFMLDKTSSGKGGGEMRGNSRARGGGKGRNSSARGGNTNSRGGGNVNTRRGGGENKNNKKGYNQNSKFNDSEKGYNRDFPPKSNRMSAAAGLMSYMLDNKSRDTPNNSRTGSFNQSSNYYPNDYDDTSRRGEIFDDASRRRDLFDDTSRREEFFDDTSRRRELFDDTSRRGEYSFSGGNNDGEYLFQRDVSREDEMNSNQNYNYGNQTECGYKILSRGFKPFKDVEQKTEYQNTNSLGSYSESFAGHPYYDNMYDQGRISRNRTENSGSFGSLGNQGTWGGNSYSSTSGENNFGFVGFPFRNRSPIYEGPKGSVKSYSNNQSLVGYSSQNTNQQDKSADSFYSYRPNDKQANTLTKTEKSGTSGIDILGGVTSLMGSYSGNSSANYGQKLASNADSNFYGKVVQNHNVGSTSNSNSRPSQDALNKDMGSDPLTELKRLRKRRKNWKYNLNRETTSQQRRDTLVKNIKDIEKEIAKLSKQCGENID